MSARRPVVECPECRERTRIPAEHAEELVKCSACGAWFAASPERERFPGRERSHTLSRASLCLSALILVLAGSLAFQGAAERITAVTFLGGGLLLAGLAAVRVRRDLHSALNFGLCVPGTLAVAWWVVALDAEARSVPVLVTGVLAGLVCFFAVDFFWGELQMELFGRTRFRSWFGNVFDRFDR